MRPARTPLTHPLRIAVFPAPIALASRERYAAMEVVMVVQAALVKVPTSQKVSLIVVGAIRHVFCWVGSPPLESAPLAESKVRATEIDHAMPLISISDQFLVRWEICSEAAMALSAAKGLVPISTTPVLALSAT